MLISLPNWLNKDMCMKYVDSFGKFLTSPSRSLQYWLLAWELPSPRKSSCGTRFTAWAHSLINQELASNVRNSTILQKCAAALIQSVFPTLPLIRMTAPPPLPCASTVRVHILPTTNHAGTIFRKQDFRVIVVKIISLLQKPDGNLLTDQCLAKYPMLRWLIVSHLTQSKRQTWIVPFKTCLLTSRPCSKQWSQNFRNLCKNWW